ncbi:hypothetical protein P280DRAFT_482018 [Massarina eburnea CBS 473.64]|uniref:Cytidyltransferase-like domain-containing protein n=1 Tax=Massarina eburnea CBS 473.64 TaxID=1395130 RepID=A0A6A6RTH9_9PLEO|nr:hypothetical protein P280DRAFT_482018 [Massarina eburnea CBS 473.64]
MAMATTDDDEYLEYLGLCATFGNVSLTNAPSIWHHSISYNPPHSYDAMMASTPTHNHTTPARLDYYIRLAYRGNLPGTIFANDNSPILSRGRINRIIIYSGAFNPPHKGHLELLRHAMFESSPDRNYIAAIVLPRSDQFIMKKTPTDCRLTCKDRARLWQTEGNDWYYIHDRGDDGFRDTLERELDDSGFEIEMSCLLGADYVSVLHTLSYRPYECWETIVCNSSRGVDFLIDTDELVPVHEYGPWRRHEPNQSFFAQLNSRAIKRFISGPPELALYSFNDDRRHISRLYTRSQSNWVCDSDNLPGSTIRFIPRQSNLPPISSTMIRNIMPTYLGVYQDLLEQLRPLALNPELLMELSGVTQRCFRRILPRPNHQINMPFDATTAERLHQIFSTMFIRDLHPSEPTKVPGGAYILMPYNLQSTAEPKAPHMFPFPSGLFKQFPAPVLVSATKKCLHPYFPQNISFAFPFTIN